MRLATILLCAALPAFANAPGFRSSAPITLGGAGSLHRVAIPLEAYRDARPDLADLRVVNAAGEAVPIAWAGEPDVAHETAATTDLPIFPVTRAEQAPGAAGTEISVRVADGTLVAIKPKGEPAKKAAPRAAAYILDASQVERPIRAFAFDWKAEPGTQVVTVRLEAGDDLKSWSPVVRSPVVRIEAGGRALTQPRVEFAPRKAKYWRITWQGNDFALAAARAELEPEVKAPERFVSTARGTPGDKPGEIVFDVGARLPVERLRIVPAETNSVLAATLHARDDEKQPWRPVLSASFYRIQRDGGEAQSQPLDVGRQSARYWMAKLAEGSTAGVSPTLEVEWRPAQLVFVTRGEAPYSLAFGQPNARPATLPVASIVPDHKRLAELKLPEARAGPVITGPPPSRLDELIASAQPRRILLWALLIAGVAVLGFMAWRLSRQM